MVKKRAEINLVEDQKALVVWDVFRGQMTEKVKDRLAAIDVVLVPVPANMNHIFQPLDLTVNGSAKKFQQSCFTEYYAVAVKEQLGSGKQLEGIEVDFRLLAVKALDDRWLIALYNYLTASKERDITLKGWKKAGVAGLFDGTTALPPEDLFHSFYTC